MDYHGKRTLVTCFLQCVEVSRIDCSPNTVRGYRSSLNSLKRFLQGKDIRLKKLNYKFISDYYNYLRLTENLQPNSAFKNIKYLKRIIHLALLNRWITSDPFKEFKCSYKQPNRPYLIEQEIELLYNQKFLSDRLYKIRDIFLFQVYTGLAYSDLYHLNIQTGVDGNKWIVIIRQKTGERIAVPILPRAMEILKRYKMRLPVYSNQKLNRYLKEIGTICNFNKTLTSHCGRHTFATTITLSHGIPIESVSKMLGHASIATTQIYARCTDLKVANDMRELLTSTH
jgi:site-specific recombinase XerD